MLINTLVAIFVHLTWLVFLKGDDVKNDVHDYQWLTSASGNVFKCHVIIDEVFYTGSYG